MVSSKLMLVGSMFAVCILTVPSVVAGGDRCPCEADVNDDGNVTIIDWDCIRNCIAGSCTCCVNSCDVNCDGSIDDQDAGPSPEDDSAWRCRFLGFPPEVCCPGPLGACCDLSTGDCQDDVGEGSCTGPDLEWTEGALCSEVSCPGPPIGACCDIDTGGCQDEVLGTGCTSEGLTWFEGLSCLQVSCPVPPGPCACNGNVDGSGGVTILDYVCIRDCIAGDCSCCVNSCDVNCDGSVDDQDAGPTSEDDSAWRCLFLGFPSEVCCPPGEEPIPTVSEWGMAVMTLLVLTAGTLVFVRRHQASFP